jgi:hypothetical protein
VADLVMYASSIGVPMDDLLFDEPQEQQRDQEAPQHGERKSTKVSINLQKGSIHRLPNARHTVSRRGEVRGIDELMASFVPTRASSSADAVDDLEWAGFLSDNDIEYGKGDGLPTTTNINHKNDSVISINPLVTASGARLGSVHVEAVLDRIESAVETSRPSSCEKVAESDSYQLRSVWRTSVIPPRQSTCQQSSVRQQRRDVSLADPAKIMATHEEEEEAGEEVAGPLVVEDSRNDQREIWEENLVSRPYVHAMPQDHLETWGLLYCGGRTPLLEALVKESKDLNIPLHEEAFDW